MAVKKYVKNVLKNNSNVSGWAGWNTVKTNAQTIGDLFKGMGKTGEPDYVAPSFEEAVKHYGLTEKDLRNRMKSHFRTAMLCAIFGLAALGWGIHLLVLKGMFLSAMVALGLSVLMFSYGFREHFYYFKIKKRRLDCTVRDWLKSFMASK